MPPKQRPGFVARVTALVWAKDASSPPGTVDKALLAANAAKTARAVQGALAAPGSPTSDGDGDDGEGGGAAATSEVEDARWWSSMALAEQAAKCAPRPVLALYTDDAALADLRGALAAGKPKKKKAQAADGAQAAEGGGDGGDGGDEAVKLPLLTEVAVRGGGAGAGLAVRTVRSAARKGEILLLHLLGDFPHAAYDALGAALKGGPGSKYKASFRCVVTLPLARADALPRGLCTVPPGRSQTHAHTRTYRQSRAHIESRHRHRHRHRDTQTHTSRQSDRQSCRYTPGGRQFLLCSSLKI